MDPSPSYAAMNYGKTGVMITIQKPVMPGSMAIFHENSSPCGPAKTTTYTQPAPTPTCHSWAFSSLSDLVAANRAQRLWVHNQLQTLPSWVIPGK